MSAPAVQFGLDGATPPRQLPDPVESVERYRALAGQLRGVPDGVDLAATIAAALEQADVLADSLEANRAATLEGFAFYEDAMRVEQWELMRLAEGNRLLRDAVQQLLDAHTAVLRASPDTDPFAGTDMPRVLRLAQETLHRVPESAAKPGEPADPQPGRPCVKCGAKLLWSKTPLGKPVPLDADSRAHRYRAVTPETVKVILTWITHFITCPFANDFKKKPTSSTPKGA